MREQRKTDPADERRLAQIYTADPPASPKPDSSSARASCVCAVRVFRGRSSDLCSLCLLLLNSSALCRPGSLGVKPFENAVFYAFNALALKPSADFWNLLPVSIIRRFDGLRFYGYPVNFTGGWGMGGPKWQ